MDLPHIPHKTCPQCGATSVVEEGRRHQHSNGLWNEYRQFTCGLRLIFTPNFCDKPAAEEQPCTRSTAYNDQVQQRRAAVATLRRTIEKLKVDEKFRATLLAGLKSHSCGYYGD